MATDGDGRYFEVYKGWIIQPGITMPSHGVHEFNVYLSTEEIEEDRPRYVAGSLEEAREWIDGQEAELEVKEGLLEVPLIEQVRHGSYVTFTDLDTGETKQYYNANPPDSPEVVSASLFIKSVLEERTGKKYKFEIKPARD